VPPKPTLAGDAFKLLRCTEATSNVLTAAIKAICVRHLPPTCKGVLVDALRVPPMAEKTLLLAETREIFCLPSPCANYTAVYSPPQFGDAQVGHSTLSYVSLPQKRHCWWMPSALHPSTLSAEPFQQASSQ